MQNKKPEIPILDNKTYIYIYSHTLKGKIKAKRTSVAHIYTYRKKEQHACLTLETKPLEHQQQKS